MVGDVPSTFTQYIGQLPISSIRGSFILPLQAGLPVDKNNCSFLGSCSVPGRTFTMTGSLLSQLRILIKNKKMNDRSKYPLEAGSPAHPIGTHFDSPAVMFNATRRKLQKLRRP